MAFLIWMIIGGALANIGRFEPPKEPPSAVVKFIATLWIMVTTPLMFTLWVLLTFMRAVARK